MIQSNNVLGNPRAESDRLLEKAFVETVEFHALINTVDFRVVVGRRGTGKSALYQQLCRYYEKQPRIILHQETQQEHHALALQERLERLGCNYRTARAACRLFWRGYILSVISRSLRNHFKLKDSKVQLGIASYMSNHTTITQSISAYEYAIRVLDATSNPTPTTLPGQVASLVEIDHIEDVVKRALEEAGCRAVLLFDSLDEGWQPSQIPTALLGGLVLTSSDLVDRHTEIHAVAFVRDNMFRALAYFDSDFSRHVEGADLRLHWDEASLLPMVTRRIRLALNLDAENDVRVWNRFARRGLEGREGFAKCLQNTLYRPRDVLVLLNKAYFVAAQSGREHIIDTDIASASRMISIERLEDLLKEYNAVLPGLRLFAEVFRGTKTTWKYGDILSLLNNSLSHESYVQEEASDFATLGSAAEIFLALYGVGFLGVKREVSQPYAFCHDGARADLANVPTNAEVAVHPCYWRGLDLSEGTESIELITNVYDEYAPVKSNELRDKRMILLGQTVEELPRIASGEKNAADFEDWSLRAVKIVFAGSLSNVALHPNGAAVQRRDIIATNSATEGFWRRIYEDYKSRQVVFEIKNYSELTLEDIRQSFSYSGREYGQIVFLLYRGENEGISEQERAWLQEMYGQHQFLPFFLPARVLQRFISKYRGKARPDYWQAVMEKRLDTHLRRWVNTKSGRRLK